MLTFDAVTLQRTKTIGSRFLAGQQRQRLEVQAPSRIAIAALVCLLCAQQTLAALLQGCGVRVHLLATQFGIARV